MQVKGLLISLSVFLRCAAVHAEESLPVTAPDQNGFVSKIESNWNVAPVLESGCTRVMVFQVRLEGDGAVKEVALVEPYTLDASCKLAAVTAERAIRLSSPLSVPQGLTDLTLRFDHTKLQ